MPQQWARVSDEVLESYLPILIGRTRPWGDPVGGSMLIDNMDKARSVLLGSEAESPRERLLSGLFAAELNVRRAQSLDEPLRKAVILGTRRTVRAEVRLANQLVALLPAGVEGGGGGGIRCMSGDQHPPDALVEQHARLIEGLNGGDVVYRPAHGNGWPPGWLEDIGD